MDFKLELVAIPKREQWDRYLELATMLRSELNEYSPVKQLWIAVIFAMSLGLVAAGERDVRRRPADQIRGSRLFWRFACLNALGAASYFRWGRRPEADTANR